MPASVFDDDINALKIAIKDKRDGYRRLRLLSSEMWFHRALALGSRALSDFLDASQGICDACAEVPSSITSGEISLAGLVNLLSCLKMNDCASVVVHRLMPLKTSPRGSDVERRWHFSRAFAGVALGIRAIYRNPAAAEVELNELMPFTPRMLYENNPQALLAHLAAGAENRVAIEDVWPAFREVVHNFPYHEEVGDFDGACLFWIARIVHHQIGGQPLGQTADWLSRHFNAWADGRELPPLLLGAS